tara:strand:- start:2311 stop:2490 length:180 start_codon:yes stop_codon:yes gene_type:complete
MEHLQESTKHVLDTASIATAVGTMMQVLPAIAALFTIIWTSIRIYETKTVQKLLGKTKE